MKIFNLHFQGGFGNRLHQYAFARGFCERYGFELRTEAWVGQKFFEIQDGPIEAVMLPEPLNESQLLDIDEFHLLNDADRFNLHFRSYCQTQKCIDFYTRSQAKKWFAFRPHIREQLQEITHPTFFVAHLRRGDYKDAGYVIVSEKSYRETMSQRFQYREHYMDENEVLFLSGIGGRTIINYNFTNPHFGTCDTMLPDFWAMMNAKVLFRANSTFSWWAAVLGSAEVYAPVIDGLEGGKEHDCAFVAGNWPKCANLSMVEDLHLKE